MTISRRHILLKLSPLLVPFAILFLGGFLLALAQSLGYFAPVPMETGLAGSYGKLFGDRWFLAAFGFTFYVALISALLSVALGTVLAYAIWNLPRSLQGPAVVYKIPLILPHIAVAFIVLVLWTQSGFFASLAHALGWIEQPADFPAVLFSGNGLGLILAYAYKGSSFVILLAYALLQRLDRRLIATARMLGASGWTTFFRIVVPHLRPVMSTSFIILFLYAFGAFDIPFLLSESYPGMLSTMIYNLYFMRDLSHRPQAMAALVVMFLFSVVFIGLYVRLGRRLSNRERKV